MASLQVITMEVCGICMSHFKISLFFQDEMQEMHRSSLGNILNDPHPWLQV